MAGRRSTVEPGRRHDYGIGQRDRHGWQHTYGSAGKVRRAWLTTKQPCGRSPSATANDTGRNFGAPIGAERCVGWAKRVCIARPLRAERAKMHENSVLE